jgi:hypothetical protein
MTSDQVTETSGRPPQARDERNPAVISPEEMKEYIRLVGKPWHHRKKKIPIRRVKALKEAGFSLRQVAKIYGTSETTIRRRLHGK